MYKTAYLTDVGLKRNENEDALLVADACGLFVVADGMGGHARGEIASRMVVESFRQMICMDEDSTVTYSYREIDDEETIPYLFDDNDDATIAYADRSRLNNTLNSVVETSTHKIMTYAEEKSIKSPIGTTIVGLYRIKNEEEMALFHLGDSRAYRVRDKEIKRLTTDHSKYEKMKQSGRYSKEELSKVSRNSITKAVGNFRAMRLDISYLELEEGDIYLLCSDGVSDLLHAKELLEIIESSKNSLDKAVLHIKELVYERGAKDNLSIILFSYKL